MNEFKDKFFEFLKNIKNNPKIIVVIGLVGILIIFLSSIFENKPQSDIPVSSENVSDEYCVNLENKLSKQIKEVVGGDVNVLITLETGVEYIYASEAKNNIKEIEDEDVQNGQKLQKDRQEQNNYILYKDENGNEVPLVVTEIMPSVKGVVVSCEKGDDEIVSSIVKNLVKTALNISDDKVCVVGIDISK